MTAAAAFPRLRLFVVLVAAGLLGVTVMIATLLPQVLAGAELPAPLWVISLVSFAQSSILVALSVWIGVVTAPAVGLRAPATEAAVSGRPLMPALKPQLVPGLAAGIASGLLLFAFNANGPEAWVEVQARYYPPLYARVLYGGIVEELLLRWGLMSALLWLLWYFLQRRRGSPRSTYVWMAIVITAVLFGAGHLPTVAAVVGSLNANLVVFVVATNGVFGLLFGWLYWRYGLEAAMLAHAVTHLVSYAAAGIGPG